MQIGFYTSTFSDRPIEEVFDFARASGFDAVEIDVGGHIKSPGKVGRSPPRRRTRVDRLFDRALRQPARSRPREA